MEGQSIGELRENVNFVLSSLRLSKPSLYLLPEAPDVLGVCP